MQIRNVQKIVEHSGRTKSRQKMKKKKNGIILE
jgi:hypothetical protein